MLYDPKWEVQTKPDVSLADFIAWLETKDGSEKYEFDDCDGACLIGQYMAARGIPWTGAPKRGSLPGNWEGSSYQKVGLQLFGNVAFMVPFRSPHTFGAALERARAAL